MKEITYTHYKNKQKYRVLNSASMQINQEWYQAIVYQDIKTLEVYVRKELSFDECFKIE
jgi:hypothetical protein